MKTRNRIGHRGAIILAWLADHPGATAADIDRATNDYRLPRRNHAVTYDAVNTLRRAGLIRRTGKVGSGMGLEVVS